MVSEVEREADDGRSLNREDVLCPICLEIYCEPVTLPCKHTFCKVCFLESVDKATLCCPLCRKRVGVWARQHSKKLVNEALWKKIQSVFPRQRLQEEEHEPVFCPRLSEPGALRQEYEDQLSKLSEEKRELDEEESRASEELIQRLLAEEEKLLQEQREQTKKQDLEDERLARLLSRELNSVSDLDQNQTPVKKKPTGIDRFLFPLSRSPAHSSSSSNKENIFFPPPLDYYGPKTDQSEPPSLHVDQSEPEEGPPELLDQSEPEEGPPKLLDQSEPEEGPPELLDQSEPEEGPPELLDQSEPEEGPPELLDFCPEEGPPRLLDQSEPEELMDQSEPENPQGGTKRKSEAEGAESLGKRSCQSSGLGVAIAEWEAEFQRRRKQEEEDLKVALELQKQLNKQQKKTDRRKGTEDEYKLRDRARISRVWNQDRTWIETKAPSGRKRTTSSTVTLASLENSEATTSNPGSSAEKTDKQRKQALNTGKTCSTEGKTDKQGAKSNQASSQTSKTSQTSSQTSKTSQTSSQTSKTSQKPSQPSPKTPRQMTLLDLFNLHN